MAGAEQAKFSDMGFLKLCDRRRPLVSLAGPVNKKSVQKSTHKETNVKNSLIRICDTDKVRRTNRYGIRFLQAQDLLNESRTISTHLGIQRNKFNFTVNDHREQDKLFLINLTVFTR